MADKIGEHKPSLLLRQRLDSAHFSWNKLVKRCEQIILFGSRATNVYGPDSDFDLLCVVPNESSIKREDLRVTPGVDLVWVSKTRIKTPEWLGSELAQHVAHYGCWLHGTNDWGHLVQPSDRAVRQKADQIHDRIALLVPRWHRLRRSYRRKYVRLIRRDLLRLKLLSEGHPVPPTPMLDSAWSQIQDSMVDWVKTNQMTGRVDLAALAKLEPEEPKVKPIGAAELSGEET